MGKREREKEKNVEKLAQKRSAHRPKPSEEIYNEANEQKRKIINDGNELSKRVETITKKSEQNAHTTRTTITVRQLECEHRAI